MRKLIARVCALALVVTSLIAGVSVPEDVQAATKKQTVKKVTAYATTGLDEAMNLDEIPNVKPGTYKVKLAPGIGYRCYYVKFTAPKTKKYEFTFYNYAVSNYDTNYDTSKSSDYVTVKGERINNSVSEPIVIDGETCLSNLFGCVLEKDYKKKLASYVMNKNNNVSDNELEELVDKEFEEETHSSDDFKVKGTISLKKGETLYIRMLAEWADKGTLKMKIK